MDSSDDDSSFYPAAQMAEIDDIFGDVGDSGDDDNLSFAPTSNQLSAANLSITDLLNPIDDSSASISLLKRNLSTSVNASQPLPLAKTAKDRIERQEAYKEARQKVSSWQETVKRNRSATSLSFPLNQTPAHQPSLSNLIASKEDEDYGDILGIPNSLDEQAKIRALLHYAGVKAKHRKSIKSKKYRSILKKEKERLLENSEQDPEDMERERAKERLTLRHKNFSRFIKRKLRRGEHKHDDVQEALLIGQEIRKKIQGDDNDSVESGSDYETETEQEYVDPEVPANISELNFVKRALEAEKRAEEEENMVSSEEESESESEVDEDQSKTIDSRVEGKKRLSNVVTPTVDSIIPNVKKSRKSEDLSIQALESFANQIVSEEESDDDNQSNLIKEVMAENDAEESFKQTKEHAITAEHEVDLPQAVPGWGDWGGQGVTPRLSLKDKSLKKHLIKKQKDDISKRTDASKPRVIISQKLESSNAKYAVKRLPFGNKNSEDYQNNLAKPISHEFVPISSFNKMIKPEIIVPKGTFIGPIKKSHSQKRKFS
ncbi:hypothetical protein RCL1_004634 [Eukaryota sp. TZLM3-RCL]